MFPGPRDDGHADSDRLRAAVRVVGGAPFGYVSHELVFPNTYETGRGAE